MAGWRVLSNWDKKYRHNEWFEYKNSKIKQITQNIWSDKHEKFLHISSDSWAYKVWYHHFNILSKWLWLTNIFYHSQLHKVQRSKMLDTNAMYTNFQSSKVDW